MSGGRLLAGLALIAVGVVLLLDRADVLDAGDTIGTYWPLALVAVAIYQYIASPRHWIVPLIVGGVGLVLLGIRLDVIDDRAWGVFWAAMLIIGGLWVIAGRRLPGSADTSDEASVSSIAFFGGRDIASQSTAFEGGSITSVFGGTELDLTDTVLASGHAHLDVLTVFGGTEITVPKGWRVRMKGIPLFGGWDNATKKDEPLPPGAPELEVSATVLFGGVEVKHPS
jgi:predicted membrane protein